MYGGDITIQGQEYPCLGKFRLSMTSKSFIMKIDYMQNLTQISNCDTGTNGFLIKQNNLLPFEDSSVRQFMKVIAPSFFRNKGLIHRLPFF